MRHLTIASGLANVGADMDAFRDFLQRHKVHDRLGLLVVSWELMVNGVLCGSREIEELHIWRASW